MRDARPRLPSPMPLALLALLGACSVGVLQPDYEAARELVRVSTGAQEVHDPAAAPLAPEAVAALLADGLTLDEAQRLALLENRRLQAAFLGLGITHAEWVQAGLLRNPSLGLAVFLPSGGGRTRLAGDLAQDIGDLWRLPERRAAAAADHEQRVLELAGLAADLVAAVRAGYCTAVAARESRALAEADAALAGELAAAGAQRVAVGAASELEAGLLRGAALESELRATQARRAESEALRNLAALLSLPGDLAGVPLTDPLPEAQPGPPAEEAVTRALAARLDVRASAAAVASAEARLAVERGESSPDLQAGLVAERPESGSTTDLLAGPGLTLELPLFDRNEAGIRRAEAERDQARKLHEGLCVEVAQQARAAADRAALAAGAAASVRDALLPQSERSLDLARRSFDLGGVPLMVLLEARRASLTARQALLDANLEAALADIELLRAVGGPAREDSGAATAAP